MFYKKSSIMKYIKFHHFKDECIIPEFQFGINFFTKGRHFTINKLRRGYHK